MSAALTGFLALGGFGVAMAPLALAYRVPRAVAPTLIFFGFILSYVLALYANPFARGREIDPIATMPVGAQLSEQCPTIMENVERTGIIVDLSSPSRPVVRAALWSQIPEEVKQVIETCLDERRPEGARGQPLEFVEQ